MMKTKPNTLPAKVRANGNTATGKRASSSKKTISKSTKDPSWSPDELDDKELLKVLAAVRNGNFSVRLPVDRIGVAGKICDTLNEIISLNEVFMQQLTLARNTIGKQGQLNHRVILPGYATGSWNAGVDSVNSLISDLVHPTIEIAHVISSVAKGNLSQEMPLSRWAFSAR